jgi:hypothetical protein
MIQAICSAGVVTTFDVPLKAFKQQVGERTCIEDTNGWYVNTKHIISFTELAQPVEEKPSVILPGKSKK